MGNTEREALEAREAYKAREQQGIRRDATRITVREYASSWLPVHKHSVGAKTYNDYAKQLDVLIDALGDMIMMDVRPSDIARVWLHYDGYSDSTIRRTAQLFRSLFDTAMDDGILRRNPMKSKHADPPEGYSGTHRAISQDERRMIHENDDHWFHPAVMVMLYAGLRRGEALALDLDRDVDYKNHVINVRYAVRFDSAGRAVLDDPKTEAGRRSVPMVRELQELLRGRHGLLAPARRTGDLMSQSAFNSAWDSYMLALNCRLNGVKQKRWAKPDRPWLQITIRPHDLRHSYCTMLRDAGVDLKVAMRWMGHADEKMILKIYDHISTARTAAAMAAVETLLDGSCRQNGRQKSSKSQKAQ